MRRNRVALLTALGVDNVGSGLFLPVALLSVTRVMGRPLATAGTVVAAGTMAGLAVPPVAGRLVDRVGPRLTVISGQSLQALGAAAYLVARDAAVVAVAAVPGRRPPDVLQLPVLPHLRPDRRRPERPAAPRC